MCGTRLENFQDYRTWPETLGAKKKNKNTPSKGSRPETKWIKEKDQKLAGNKVQNTTLSWLRSKTISFKDCGTWPKLPGVG